MRRVLLVLVILGCAAAAPVLAQQHGSAPDSAGARRGGEGGMMNHAMMARMDSLGARLDSLTRVMIQATGPRKVDAMAEVLTALVGHHLEMQRHMHEGMMNRERGEGQHGQVQGKRSAADPGAHNH
jgi:hypothetical protein